MLLVGLCTRCNTQGETVLVSGAITCLYALIYSLGRSWIEGLRPDPLRLFGTLADGNCIRIAQVVSILLAAAGVAGLAWLYAVGRELPDPGRPQ